MLGGDCCVLEVMCLAQWDGSPFLSHQALDGDFSEDNRNKCRIATTPLIEAVENLTAFASNPEFASIPAQISSEVGSLQQVKLKPHWLILYEIE